MLDRNANAEPWLRGTRQAVPALPRAVLHALDLTRGDFERWVWSLPAELIDERPYNLPSVGFQARHIARSLDRLLTYAEGNKLSEVQQGLLATEAEGTGFEATREEFLAALALAEDRITELPLTAIEDARYVGRARLAVTLGGLLTHLADHTQRHAGQAVTTAKLLRALHGAEQS